MLRPPTDRYQVVPPTLQHVVVSAYFQGVTLAIYYYQDTTNTPTVHVDCGVLLAWIELFVFDSTEQRRSAVPGGRSKMSTLADGSLAALERKQRTIHVHRGYQCFRTPGERSMPDYQLPTMLIILGFSSLSVHSSHEGESSHFSHFLDQFVSPANWSCCLHMLQ